MAYVNVEELLISKLAENFCRYVWICFHMCRLEVTYPNFW